MLEGSKEIRLIFKTIYVKQFLTDVSSLSSRKTFNLFERLENMISILNNLALQAKN